MPPIEVWVSSKILGRYRTASRHRVLTIALTLLLNCGMPFATGVGLTVGATRQYLAWSESKERDSASDALYELRRGQSPEKVDAFLGEFSATGRHMSPLAQGAVRLLASLYRIPSQYGRNEFAEAMSRCETLGWERCDFEHLEVCYWMLP